MRFDLRNAGPARTYSILGMSKLVAKILFFPLAALALGAAYQPVHPKECGLCAPHRRLTRTASNASDRRKAQPKISSGEWLLVDARCKEQFNAQHIPGEASLPSAAYEEMLHFFAEEHGREKAIVIYCGSEDWEMGTELAMRLRELPIDSGCVDLRRSAFRARGTDHARRRDIAQRCAARADRSARGADQKKPAA